MTAAQQPRALWIVGGLDPSGGAGVLRDFATARAVGPSLPTHTVITTFTTQGDGAPATGRPMSAEAFQEQFVRAPVPSAIKVGLVPASLVPTLVTMLSQVRSQANASGGVPVVLDPVLAASAGGTLGATAEGLEPLFRVATLLTPNLPELSAIHPGGGSELRDTLGIAGVLVKGGHATGTEVVDTLHLAGESLTFARPRQIGRSPRGTGCALATAIACGLAQKAELSQACRDAIAWLDAARPHATTVGPQTLL